MAKKKHRRNEGTGDREQANEEVKNASSEKNEQTSERKDSPVESKEFAQQGFGAKADDALKSTETSTKTNEAHADADKLDREKDPSTALTVTTPSLRDTREVNLGRLFFGFTILFIGILIIANAAGWLGPVTVSYFALWPLVLVLLGFSLFRVRTRSAKVVGSIAVIIVFLLALGVLFKGSNIIAVSLSGAQETEDRSLEEFTSVSIGVVGDVIIREGATSSVSMMGDGAVLSEVDTQVVDGVLSIDYHHSLWDLFMFEDAHVSLEIISPDITRIDLRGIGTLEGSDIAGEELTLLISGNGLVNVSNIEVDSLTTRITGAGEVTLQGGATRQLVVINGAGEYLAEELASRETGISINGIGSAIVNAEDTLYVEINGAGNVIYTGNPEIEESINGVGEVRSAEDAALEEENVSKESENTEVTE